MCGCKCLSDAKCAHYLYVLIITLGGALSMALRCELPLLHLKRGGLATGRPGSRLLRGSGRSHTPDPSRCLPRAALLADGAVDLNVGFDIGMNGVSTCHRTNTTSCDGF
eukprot:4036718-Prymnesium_polylepis.1